jgi:hypothetical protein
MYWFGHLLQLSSVALQLCVLALTIWRGLSRRFSLFAIYTAYIICITTIRSIVLSNHMLYFYMLRPGAIDVLEVRDAPDDLAEDLRDIFQQSRDF